MGYLLNSTTTEVLRHDAQTGGVGAAVSTIAAQANTRWQVLAVYVGYAAAAAAGTTLTIAWTRAGAAQTFVYYVPVTGATQQILFPYGAIVGDDNTAITITAAISGTTVSKLSVFYGGG